MPLELIRIDERLLHGQVVVGWGERLGLRWYVVVDDELATSGWEQKLYAGGLPEDVEAEFWSVGEAASRFGDLEQRPEGGGLLTRDTASMRRLVEEGGLGGIHVNLGCLGGSADRSEALPYLHLSPEEIADVEAMLEAGVRVTARDVPDARPVRAEKVIRALRD